MTTTLTSTVMRRLDSDDQTNGRAVTFIAAYDDDGLVYRTLILSPADWDDLGQPQQITVTIAPGDTLN